MTMNRKLALFALSIGLWILLVAAPAQSADPSGGSLRVGAAAANFTADDKMQIACGIDPQYFQGQEGELRAVGREELRDVEAPFAERVGIDE